MYDCVCVSGGTINAVNRGGWALPDSPKLITDHLRRNGMLLIYLVVSSSQ